MGRGKNRKKKMVQSQLPLVVEKKDLKMETKLMFLEEAYQKMFHWVDKAPGEVSGMGVIEMRNNVPYVVDVMLFEQENTGTSTDLNSEALGAAMFDFHVSQRSGFLNFWWHSHVHMGVFWSGTDNQTIRDIGGGGWVISTVVNKKREMLTAFYITQPLPLFVDQVLTKVEKVMDQSLTAQWDAEYLLKCKEKSYSRGRQVWRNGVWEEDKTAAHQREPEYLTRYKDSRYTPTFGETAANIIRSANPTPAQTISEADLDDMEEDTTGLIGDLGGVSDMDLNGWTVVDYAVDYRDEMTSKGVPPGEITAMIAEGDHLVSTPLEHLIPQLYPQGGGYGGAFGY